MAGTCSSLWLTVRDGEIVEVFCKILETPKCRHEHPATFWQDDFILKPFSVIAIYSSCAL
jgi:hypothetical protein